MNIEKKTPKKEPDVVLIGAGIMSATLGIMLKQLQPDLTIELYERLDVIAGESSDAWNNAGTGHSALCELNYTPQRADGTIDCSKAIAIDESFEISRQFWAYLVEQKIIDSPENFIRSIPHMSFVWGEENVNFLKKRHQALLQYHPFKAMQYSENHQQLAEWMPIVMEGRDETQQVAATRMEIGTDVNFGALTRSLLAYLDNLEGVKVHLSHEVQDIDRKDNQGKWTLKFKNLLTGKKRKITTNFVFIGAGGGSLPLLEKSNLPEGKGFGGFPVSGQWLKCTNPAVIERHHAKVYGKASVGAPPMSVPHLDSRMIDGEKALLFGPYAGFSTKFLKNGSYLDLVSSIKLSNIVPMISAGLDNIPLTKYLIHEVTQSAEDKLESLRAFLPTAVMDDWEIEVAGQRVQVIKKDEEHGGILEFGTEIVSAADGSLSALLGASPGASTSVSEMLNVIHKCFPAQIQSSEWQDKVKQMIPSFGQSLVNNPALCDQVREWTSEVLNLTNAAVEIH
jgi:malate dehydrogenase (quinone)